MWLKLSTTVRTGFPILSGVIPGIVIGIVLTTPFNGRTDNAVKADLSTNGAIARLSSDELEHVALNVLSTLSERRGSLPQVSSQWSTLLQDDEHNVRMGIANARRLLPLAKDLTIESLSQLTKNPNLSREKALIRSVRWVVLASRLGNFAEVREEDLSVIYVGAEYAADLISDDQAMLLLGHELTHVAARTGRLNHYVDEVNATVQRSANIHTNEAQKEELACDYVAAEVLKTFIATHRTSENDADRFSRAFGYEAPGERLTRAWIQFCAAYYGDPGDQEHLNEQQTIRSLRVLDPDLKALMLPDAIAADVCHLTR